MLRRKHIKTDFCVIGGGISGICAAIAAARNGAKVVLMHERPVLGGNASSEIRMWVCGAQGENNRETGIIEEIALENYYRNPTKNFFIFDTVLYDFVMQVLSTDGNMESITGVVSGIFGISPVIIRTLLATFKSFSAG